MRRPPADELFYDSEATLRLVDDAIEELRAPLLDHLGSQPAPSNAGSAADTQTLLPPRLAEIYAEVDRVVARLRRSRDLLQGTVLQAVQRTNATLLAVGTTTRTAVAEMIDGLDRALAIVDELETEERPGGVGRAATLRSGLRGELHGLLRSLQFQDLTSQQLAAAADTLAGMEQRLARIANLLDPQP